MTVTEKSLVVELLRSGRLKSAHASALRSLLVAHPLVGSPLPESELVLVQSVARLSRRSERYGREAAAEWWP